MNQPLEIERKYLILRPDEEQLRPLCSAVYEMEQLESPFVLRNARHLAADYIRRSVREGDTVVDATMGNGGDTLFLAQDGGQSAELRIVIYISKVFPLFLFAGFAIAKDKLKIPLIVSGPVALACAIVMPLLADHCVKERDMALYSIINEYHFPVTVLGAAALFALFKAFDKIDLGAADKFFAQVEKCSFGIYLLHMVLLKLVFAVWGFDPFDHGGLIMVFLISLAVFLVTFIVVRLLRFIPLVNKVI